MYRRHRTGVEGEDIANRYLKMNNYTILDRNFSCRQGEIDIIAKDNIMNEYVFIEVKTRKNDKYGEPVEAVDKKKQKHIVYATEYYVYKNELENAFIRFDVISIYKNKLTHYKDCEMKN